MSRDPKSPLHIKYLTIKTLHKNVVIFGIVAALARPGVEYFIGASGGEKERLPRKRDDSAPN